MSGTALITGGSKGIGFAMARELAKRGYNLILVARSSDELQKACSQLRSEFSVKADAFVADLSKQESAEKIKDYITANSISLNVLINNAGYGLWGGFEELTLQEQEMMMTVNITNLVRLTYLLLPVLHKQKKSYLLNVSSTSAYQAVPRLNVYSASKVFVLHFTRALKIELAKSNVSVSCLVPGTTTTNFMDRAGMTSNEMKKRAAKFTMDATVVAKTAIEGMFEGKPEIIPGFTNWFSAKMTRFVPKSLPEKIAAALYKKD
jgi:short-subunit dehydrogenase